LTHVKERRGELLIVGASRERPPQAPDERAGGSEHRMQDPERPSKATGSLGQGSLPRARVT